MDTTTVTKVVDVALAQLRARLPAREEQQQLPQDLQEALLEHELSRDIQTALAAQEEFSHPLLINTLSGAMGFNSQWVAPMLLREAKRRESAAAAVAWLEKVLTASAGAGIAVSTMWGIIPEGPVVLPGGVQLVPFNLLPPSRQKDALEERQRIDVPRLVAPAFMWQAPTAALTLDVEVTPYLRRTDAEAQTQNRVEHHQLFDDVRLCLASSGPIAIIPGPGWFQYTDPDLEAALLGSSTHQRHQEVTPMVLEDHGAFDADRAVKLLRDFTRCQPGVKNRLRTAMDRLSRALVRLSPADKALELAIALEALLVDSAGEHTFKIALRAALLTGSDRERRRRSRAIIEAMYKVRSSLMHSGQASEVCKVRGFDDMPTTKMISEAIGITAQVVQNIVAQSDIPDWSALELSGLSETAAQQAAAPDGGQLSGDGR